MENAISKINLAGDFWNGHLWHLCEDQRHEEESLDRYVLEITKMNKHLQML